MPYVTLDFETYFDKDVSLRKLNTIQYTAHPNFHVHGAHIKIDDQPSQWFTGFGAVIKELQRIEEEEGDIKFVAQNTAFDAYILWYFSGYAPSYYIDTMAMSRGIWPGQSASLDALCKRLWPNNEKMRKGKELVNFKAVTLDELLDNPDQFMILQNYCEQDVELTWAAFKAMAPYYPDEEMDLIDITTRMFAEPLLRLDVPRLEAFYEQKVRERQEAISASGLAESTLASNTQFLKALQSRDINIEYKENPNGEMIPALGKSDIGFQTMLRAYPEHQPLWDGRIAAKSVGAISRAERFIETAKLAKGYMPVPLRYYAAHTGRYGGCLVGDTQVLVYSHNEMKEKRLIDVEPDDLVWDGQEFVAHEGVVYSGVQEVITYDGITGTPNHVVFTESGAEKPLAQAREDGDRVKVCNRPDPNQVDVG